MARGVYPIFVGWFLFLLLGAATAQGWIKIGSHPPVNTHDDDEDHLPPNADSWVIFSEDILDFTPTLRVSITKSHKPHITGKKRSHGDSSIHSYRVSGKKKSELRKHIINTNNASFVIEPNIRFQHFGSAPTTSWALDMMNQMNPPVDGLMFRDPTLNGTGQHAFVVDTGVYNHPFFLHPVQYDFDAINIPMLKSDPNGHGSHVGGLIASPYHGSAPETLIHSIRVLDADGSGYLDDVAAGLQWIYDHGPAKVCAVSMSLGSPSGSVTMTNIINKLVYTKQYVVIVAAGNDNQDASKTYPAQLSSVIAVGATDEQDGRSYFSNYGSTVALYAPGSNILSLGNTGTSTTYKSGTSMATPLTSGVMCLILQAKELYPTALVNVSPRNILLQSLVTFNNNIQANRLYLHPFVGSSTGLSPSTFASTPSVASAPLLPSPPPKPITALPPYRNDAARPAEPNIHIYFLGVFFIVVVILF